MISAGRISSARLSPVIRLAARAWLSAAPALVHIITASSTAMIGLDTVTSRGPKYSHTVRPTITTAMIRPPTAAAAVPLRNEPVADHSPARNSRPPSSGRPAQVEHGDHEVGRAELQHQLAGQPGRLKEHEREHPDAAEHQRHRWAGHGDEEFVPRAPGIPLDLRDPTEQEQRHPPHRDAEPAAHRAVPQLVQQHRAGEQHRETEPDAVRRRAAQTEPVAHQIAVEQADRNRDEPHEGASTIGIPPPGTAANRPIPGGVVSAAGCRAHPDATQIRCAGGWLWVGGAVGRNCQCHVVGSAP